MLINKPIIFHFNLNSSVRLNSTFIRYQLFQTRSNTLTRSNFPSILSITTIQLNFCCNSTLTLSKSKKRILVTILTPKISKITIKFNRVNQIKIQKHISICILIRVKFYSSNFTHCKLDFWLSYYYKARTFALFNR